MLSTVIFENPMYVIRVLGRKKNEKFKQKDVYYRLMGLKGGPFGGFILGFLGGLRLPQKTKMYGKTVVLGDILGPKIILFALISGKVVFSEFSRSSAMAASTRKYRRQRERKKISLLVPKKMHCRALVFLLVRVKRFFTYITRTNTFQRT